MSRSRNAFFIALLISSIIFLMGFSYDNLSLNKEEQKKLQKLQNLNSEAQELFDKANSIFSEVAVLDLTESKNEKKAESLKDKALDLQVEALEKQKEANFLEYNILIEIAPVLKEDYIKTHGASTKLGLYEEYVEELFFKAEKLRNDAYKLEKEDKQNRYEKLLKAQKEEKSGLDKQKDLIDIYLGNVVLEDESKETLKTDARNNVTINDELLQVYLDYMKQPETPSRVDVLRNVMNSDSLNSENLRNTWEKTLYEEPVSYAKNETVQDSSLIHETALQEDYTETESASKDVSIAETKKVVIFKINIAADKNPLSQSVLRKIHEDNKSLNMIKEDGWDKYSIGDFATFEEAEKYKNKIGISEAFVVGVEEGVRINITAIDSKDEKPVQNKNVKLDLPEGFVFKVQISASRNKLSEEMLRSLYFGSEKIDMLQEDNWYKYSVGSYSTFKQAVNLKKTISAKGAFIVAYYNGVKTPLYLAQKGKVPQESKGDRIVFKVQIAADTEALSSEALHKIYSGHENIQKYNEDGWNKYAIGEFNTFDEANEFRENCKVKGAFVIAFRGKEKINVLEAKKMKQCANPKIITDWITNNDQVVFRVQIAASGNKLSVNQVKNICCIEPNVYLIEEDSWYKYSIGDFQNYEAAVKLKEKTGINGAFVVVYKNGKKISLTKALNMSK